jgi:tetratricopeptide (TPR) repeat protein
MKMLSVFERSIASIRHLNNLSVRSPRIQMIILAISLAILGWTLAGGAQLDPLLQEALAAHKVGNTKKAIEVYSEYIRKNPRSAEALNWRAMAYEDQGMLAEALADYNQALGINQKYADAFNNRGEVYRKQQNYAAALKDYQAAIGIEPGFAEPYYNMGLVFEAQGNKAGASKQFLKYLKANPAAADKKEILQKIQELVKQPPAAPAPPKPVAQAQPPAPAPPAAPPPGEQPAKTPPPQAAPPTAPAAPKPAPVGQAVAQKPPEKRLPPPPPGVQLPPRPGEKQAAPQPMILPFLGIDIGPLISGLLVAPKEIGPAAQYFDLTGSIVSLLLYLFSCAMLFLIAEKTNTGLAWLAFVPIAQIYILAKAAGKPGWWLILLLVPLVNIVVFLVVSVGIARRRGKSVLWGILMFIPCTTLIALGYLGLSR